MLSLVLTLSVLTSDPAYQQSTGRSFLDKLVSAKFLKFSVECSTTYQSLPDDPRVRTHLKGTLIVSKDGRWRWTRPDGWDLLFDGHGTYLTTQGSTWHEPTASLDLLNEPLDTDRLKGLLLGMGPFFAGKWKGVLGQQDWLPITVETSAPKGNLIVAQPKSKDLVSVTKVNTDITAAVYLQFDSKTMVPLFGETWDSQSQDRTELHTVYGEFMFDPPGGSELLRKPVGRARTSFRSAEFAAAGPSNRQLLSSMHLRHFLKRHPDLLGV